jgi:hypothetical protein
MLSGYNTAGMVYADLASRNGRRAVRRAAAKREAADVGAGR